MLTYIEFCDLMGVLFCLQGERLMSRHDFIVSTLVKMGFRTALRGFDQLCYCIERYSDDRTATVGSIYCNVAAVCGCSKSAVEKNLRRLFTGCDASAKIGALIGIDFIDTGNKEIIAVLANYIGLNHKEGGAAVTAGASL